MKVLISAFECNPYGGSDSYVGWSYVKNMAELNEVYVLTRTANRKNIEKYTAKQNDVKFKNLHFIYVEQSKFFTRVLYWLNRYLGFLGSYFVWQRSAYKAAKKLCNVENIKIAHHVSIADFRCAGYLWKLNIPFIFGPIGGGRKPHLV